MVVGLPYRVGEGLVDVAIKLRDRVVLKDVEFVAHEFECHINLIQVALAANQHLLVVLNQVHTLAEHSPQHRQCGV